MFEKLKEIREYEGLTQKEVAKLLNVTRATYAGWECGKDIIPLRKLNKFANTFHVSLDYLVGIAPEIEIINESYEIDVSNVAKQLKNVRLKNNFSQKQMASSIKTSQSNIHKYETGKSLITTTYALEFSKQYNYSLDKLLDRNKKTTKNL